MQKRNYLPIVIGVALAIIAVQIGIGLATYALLPDWPTRGQFGDVFGAANALFSGLAFAGLIYAILLQREDLALQRTELELTRQELQRTAAAQEQSEIALRAQASAAARSARLSAISFLLDHYQTELKQLRLLALPANCPQGQRLRDLSSREQQLVAMLDSMFDDISRGEI